MCGNFSAIFFYNAIRFLQAENRVNERDTVRDILSFRHFNIQSVITIKRCDLISQNTYLCDPNLYREHKEK